MNKSSYRGFGHVLPVKNKAAHGAADFWYYHIRAVDACGHHVDLLLTQEQVAIAVVRAHKNPEDLLRPQTWFQKLWDQLVRFDLWLMRKWNSRMKKVK